MKWNTENISAVLSPQSNAVVVCNGIAVDRISETSIRILFDYTNYVIYTTELEQLAEEIKIGSKGSVFVIVDTANLERGIINLEYNPIKKPEFKALGGAITDVCNFIEMRYV
ncbi:hypothetical protein IKD98_00345 [Candidatus Saccharibacteria bacterium]|nr:hypothetical protein [Candidatus Saccharibacteria bacterium]